MPNAPGHDQGLGASNTKEIIMSTIIRSAIVAIALVAGATAASAQPVRDHGARDYQYSGSIDRDRAFWDDQQRNGD
jgi:hypothetical protein